MMSLYNPIDQTKECGQCRKRKSVAEFNRQSGHGTDPYANKCRACARASYKLWAEKNKARKTAYMREWYAENIENVKKYDAERYRHNGVERQRQRVALNRDKYASYGHAHRTRKAAGGVYTSDDVERIKKQQRGKCASCRKKLIQFEIDHIHPLSRGGSNWPKNIQLLCPTCNRSKGATEPMVFMRRMGRLL